MAYLINPNFLFRNLTGIERFAYEICKRLDSLISQEDDIGIIIPSNVRNIPDYKNIKIIKVNKPLKSFPFWDLFQFSKYCKKSGAIGINFSNTASFGKKCGISFIHDIYAQQFPQDFNTFNDRLIRLYSCFNYKNITKHAKMVLTVSEFSKEQILKTYKLSENKIDVIPNGWEHFKDISEEEVITDAPLDPGSFYFTVGSLQKRKNLKWIVEYAKKHPEENFVISGKALPGFSSKTNEITSALPNVKMLGYLTDGQVKYLMKNCKAFLFPSYYEGFGIPPLEALTTGAKIIVANAASLPDIYKKSAIYIDPYNTDCNLQELLNKNAEDCKKYTSEVLEEFSYDKAAQKLYKILKENRI